jgi:hypothetical protein
MQLLLSYFVYYVLLLLCYTRLKSMTMYGNCYVILALFLVCNMIVKLQ